MSDHSSNNGYAVCIGMALIDCLVKGFDRTPISTTGYFAESVSLKPGGEAVNQTVTFAKIGKPARAVCLLCPDSGGTIIEKELSSYGVDLSCAARPADAVTPVTVMFVDEAGDRKSVTSRAHRYNFHPERMLSAMDGGDAVSLCSLFRAPFNDAGIVSEVVKEAARRSLPVYADTKLPTGARLTLDDLKDSLPMMECIFPNETEGAWYTGKKDPEEMADVFLDYGVKNVVIKLGGRGCLLKNPSVKMTLPGIPVDAVDATGAGDSFMAGFIAMRSEGKSLGEALRFANACGAVCSTAVGATAGIRDRGQILEVMQPEEFLQ